MKRGGSNERPEILMKAVVQVLLSSGTMQGAIVAMGRASLELEVDLARGSGSIRPIGVHRLRSEHVGVANTNLKSSPTSATCDLKGQR